MSWSDRIAARISALDRGEPPIKKPSGLQYGVNDVPPTAVTWLNAIQQVAIITIYLIYPLLLFRAAEITPELSANLLSIGFLVLGAATFLQAFPKGPIGSGYMCPATFTATFVGPSLSAVKLGGLPLLFGMTLLAGVFESLLSRLLTRLRHLLPAEISGFVVLMVGVTAGVAGVRTLLGAGGPQQISGAEWEVAVITLATMVGLNIWATGLWRMTCALAGLVVGYVAAAGVGFIAGEQFDTFLAAPIVAVPSFSHLSWSFDVTLAIPFVIASLALTLKSVGTVTLCQKLNDDEWIRPDMASNSRGVLADGLGNTIAGLLGSFGINTCSPSVAISGATGVTARRVAFVVGGIFIVIGLLPKLTIVFALMPRPVMAAALMFATCFILINGMQMITSRMMDARKTLVIGLSTVAALSVEIFPSIEASAPMVVKPLLSSALVFGTLVALSLNLLFRLGVRQRVRLTVDPAGDYATQIEDFFKQQGGKWGARPEIIGRAIFGITQLVEVVTDFCQLKGAVEVNAHFEEFSLDIELGYDGEQLELPETRPSEDEIRETDDGLRKLAGFMLRRNADSVVSARNDGHATVRFHFDH